MRVRLLMTAAVLAAATLLTPALADAKRSVPQRFYGVMWDRATVDAPEAEQAAQFELMASSGVETVRTVFPWWKIEPDPGQPPDFSDTDRLVALASTHDIRMLPVVAYTPSWAAIDPGRYASPPRDVDDYTAFLENLITRYGPAGTFWDGATRPAATAAARVADLERAPSPELLGHDRPRHERLGARVRGAAEGVEPPHQGPRPRRHGRARRPRRLRLAPLRPARALQDRAPLRRRRAQLLHVACRTGC